MRCFALLALMFIMLLQAAPAGASASQPWQMIDPERLSDQARLSVVTIYPGDHVHAWYGHTAIRLHDPLSGLDVAYNYGVFDFDSPLFVLTFARGHLDYILAVHSFADALDHYRAKGRAVVEQVLDLNLQERNEVVDFLERNALPEHREYRYRFLDNNCSTRVRDALEQVLGDRISFADAPIPQQTYRQALRPYTDNRPGMQLLIELGLAQPADRTVDAHQAMFLPLPLREAFDAATLERGGERVPLVLETNWLYRSTDAARIDTTGMLTERAFDWPALLLWGLLIVGVVRTFWQYRQAEPVQMVRRSRWTADAMLLILVGLVGTVGLALWTLTAHEVTGPNWNVLWAWPTHLLAGVVLLLWPGSRALQLYLAITALLTLAVVLAWGALPQTLPLTVLPVALLLIARAGWLSYEIHRGLGGQRPAAPASSA